MSSAATENESSDGARSQGPTAAQIRAELQRILSSHCFGQAGRSSEFLKFVVAQTLAGEGDRLKGYTIALEVFGRSQDFDAQSDPLVRVEAGRLRRRLMEYYVAEGHANPLRIELPRGRYAPEFSFAASESVPASAEVKPQVHTGFRRRLAYTGVAIAAAAIAAVIAAVTLAPHLFTPSPAVHAPAGLAAGAGNEPRVLVEPFANLTDDRSLDYFAAGVTEEIMLRLNDFKVAVIAGRPGTAPAPAGVTQREPDAAYVLSGNVRKEGDRVRIAARLVLSDTGAQLWTSAYDEALTVSALLAIEEKTARQVTDTIAVLYGPIFEQELARTIHKPPEQLETYDCVLKYYAYRRQLDPVQHRGVLDCFQQAVKREPNFADAWAGLALVDLDEYAYNYDPQPGPVGALDRAREAARTALDIDGDNLLANLALARVRFFSGDLDGFARSTQRIATLGATNTDALALTGALWTLAGFPDRGLPLVKQAEALAPLIPAAFVARAAIDIREGRANDALEEMLKVDMPKWSLVPVLVAATAGLAGRQDVARRAAARIREINPTFPQHARAELSKWQIDDKLLAEFLRGLRAAGLDVE